MRPWAALCPRPRARPAREVPCCRHVPRMQLCTLLLLRRVNPSVEDALELLTLAIPVTGAAASKLVSWDYVVLPPTALALTPSSMSSRLCMPLLLLVAREEMERDLEDKWDATLGEGIPCAL